MKWKDSDEALDSGNETGSTYEEDYSPLRGRSFNLRATLASLVSQPGVWVITVALISLFAIFVIFFPKGEAGAPHADSSRRWQELESKMTSLEKQNETMNGLINTIQQSNESLLVRLDRLESKFGRQLNDYQRQLKQLSSIKSKQKSGTPPVASTKKSTQKAAKTYIVQKGDTLYSISKKIGLSVSQLRKLNKLSSNQAIFPGQKLIIRP